MSASRFFLAIVFWVAENRHFGWNWTAQSDAELIADGIFILLIALAVKTAPPSTFDQQEKK